MIIMRNTWGSKQPPSASQLCSRHHEIRIVQSGVEKNADTKFYYGTFLIIMGKRRGPSFKLEEGTDLARFWVSGSAQHDEQNGTRVWNNVAREFRKQPQAAEQLRSASSLSSTWVTLQKQVQKYIAAERLYLSQPESGTTPEEPNTDIMRLYRSRSKKFDTFGVERMAEPLPWMGAVDVLRRCPKFGGGCVQDICMEEVTIRMESAHTNRQL